MFYKYNSLHRKTVFKYNVYRHVSLDYRITWLHFHLPPSIVDFVIEIGHPCVKSFANLRRYSGYVKFKSLESKPVWISSLNSMPCDVRVPCSNQVSHQINVNTFVLIFGGIFWWKKKQQTLLPNMQNRMTRRRQCNYNQF